MFDPRDKQLGDLETAYSAFMETLKSLASEKFLASLGDWTPRDIAAHFVGWNRITLVGCSELREGVEPFYFYDGTNDYRKVNARFLVQFPSPERDELLKEINVTKDALVACSLSRQFCHGSTLCRLACPRLPKTQAGDSGCIRHRLIKMPFNRSSICKSSL